jgi:hypothetical protein
MGGLGILSYKTVAPHAYAAASEAADSTLAPILTPESLPASTQLITQHQRCQEIFAGNRETLLGSLTPEQAKAVIEASSKLGRVWHTTTPFQPSLRLTDVEVTAALQLRILTGGGPLHPLRRGKLLRAPRGLPPEETVACGPTRGSQAHHRTGPCLHPRHSSQTRTSRPPDQQAQRHPGYHSAWFSGHGTSQRRVRPHGRLTSKQGRPCHKPPESGH